MTRGLPKIVRDYSPSFPSYPEMERFTRTYKRIVGAKIVLKKDSWWASKIERPPYVIYWAKKKRENGYTYDGWGLLEHEMAHILFTPNNFSTEVEEITSKLNRQRIGVSLPEMRALYNLLEDERIESLWSLAFPGSEKRFKHNKEVIANMRKNEPESKVVDSLISAVFWARFSPEAVEDGEVLLKIPRADWEYVLKALDMVRYSNSDTVYAVMIKLVKRFKRISREVKGFTFEPKKIVDRSTKSAGRTLMPTASEGGVGENGENDDTESEASGNESTENEESTVSGGMESDDTEDESEVSDEENEELIGAEDEEDEAEDETDIYEPPTENTFDEDPIDLDELDEETPETDTEEIPMRQRDEHHKVDQDIFGGHMMKNTKPSETEILSKLREQSLHPDEVEITPSEITNFHTIITQSSKPLDKLPKNVLRKYVRIIRRLRITQTVTDEEGDEVDIDEFIQNKVKKNVRDVFVSENIVRKGKAKLVVLVDLSGSMDSSLEGINEALRIIWGIKNEVPELDIEVYGYFYSNPYIYIVIPKENCGFEYTAGITPTLGAVRWGIYKLKQDPEKKKFLLLITDGFPNVPRLDQNILNKMIRKELINAQRYGIKFSVINIGNPFIRSANEITIDTLYMSRNDELREAVRRAFLQVFLNIAKEVMTR